jgi:hypothetical protein
MGRRDAGTRRLDLDLDLDLVLDLVVVVPGTTSRDLTRSRGSAAAAAALARGGDTRERSTIGSSRACVSRSDSRPKARALGV